MSAKKNPSKNQATKHAKAPPMLEEKQNFFKKIGTFTSNLPLKKLNDQVKNDIINFAKISVIAIPGVLVLSGSLVGTDMLLHGRILPGTSIGSSALGFTYSDAAANIVQKTADNYLKTPITVSVNGSETQVTPEELGVQFSAPQTLRTLPTYDFRKDSVLTLASSALSGYKAQPLMTVDSQTAQNVIEQKLGLVQLRAQDAHISFDAQKNPTIVAESNGKVLNKDELISQLNQSMQNLQSTNINLTLVDETPTVTAMDLEPKKQLIAGMIKSPITLQYNGQQWKFDPSKHLDALTFESNPTVTLKSLNLTLPVAMNDNQPLQSNENVALNKGPVVSIDKDKINDFLQTQIISKIDQPTSDVKIYTDANKKIVIDGKGENGVKVSSDGLLASLDLAMNSDVKELEVPATEEKAKVTVSDDLQNLGIKNLIATGRTVFAGSHGGRIANINVGISRYNGLLVQPNEIFSFDDNLGPVDGQHGYVKELVITAGGTLPDYGGGLCQVSSTLYQAALFAGFPILERANHSYAVSYYAKPLGYGLDATIYPGVHDVKFKNDSPAAFIIQSYTENGQAYFKFYGTDDGRKVTLVGPTMGNYKAPPATQIVQTNTLPPGATKQVEINHTGFDVTWYRYITKDGTTTKEKLFTRYDNTPAKILVGAGSSPAVAQAVVSKT